MISLCSSLSTQSSCVSPEGGGSQIIRRRESLVLYKSFNTLWGAVSINQIYTFGQYCVHAIYPHSEIHTEIHTFMVFIYYANLGILFNPLKINTSKRYTH
jgi:hypothetical protein